MHSSRIHARRRRDARAATGCGHVLAEPDARLPHLHRWKWQNTMAEAREAMDVQNYMLATIFLIIIIYESLLLQKGIYIM